MTVKELRLVVTADDYDEAVTFYRLETPGGIQLTLFTELDLK
ncbi:hypothetical protein AB0F43_11145 [Kribbella sp. NPDC023972]